MWGRESLIRRSKRMEVLYMWRSDPRTGDRGSGEVMEYNVYEQWCKENNLPVMDREEYEAELFNRGMHEEMEKLFDIGSYICRPQRKEDE
jgi:hypothetical protein